MAAFPYLISLQKLPALPLHVTISINIIGVFLAYFLSKSYVSEYFISKQGPKQ